MADTDRGLVRREEFAAIQSSRTSETSIAGVSAREQAIIQAEYVMAERHQRTWMDVRAAMLQHLARPRFAEISRYAKPIGKELVNGEWVEKKARGFGVRFAETLAQEMGNVKPWSSVTYEDELLRIVRIGVTDLERNIPRSREVSFGRVTEKRGRKKKDVWEPPEGREVISQRINTRGEPVYLVRATEDEMRSKVNSEESKTQRDFILRLCPRDILDDCEDQYRKVTESEIKKDPLAALKRLLDRFAEYGIRPSDLETYIGRTSKLFTTEDLQELTELGAAIRDGQVTFQEALRLRYAEPEIGEDETPQQHDARLRRQMGQQSGEAAERVAIEKIAALKPITQEDVARVEAELHMKKAAAEQAGSSPAAVSTVSGGQEAGDSPKGSGEQSGESQPEEPPSQEEMDRLMREADKREQSQGEGSKKLRFGRKP